MQPRRFQQKILCDQGNFFFQKLLEYGITGNIFKIIKSICGDPGYSVLVHGAISPKFSSPYRVKQDCSLSTILSYIFENGIHVILQDYGPVKIGYVPINKMSWSDDLLHLSCSREGLQSCLNKLKNYCTKWRLTVNEKNIQRAWCSPSQNGHRIILLTMVRPLNA